jgi:hypothetical protein
MTLPTANLSGGHPPHTTYTTRTRPQHAQPQREQKFRERDKDKEKELELLCVGETFEVHNRPSSPHKVCRMAVVSQFSCSSATSPPSLDNAHAFNFQQSHEYVFSSCLLLVLCFVCHCTCSAPRLRRQQHLVPLPLKQVVIPHPPVAQPTASLVPLPPHSMKHPLSLLPHPLLRLPPTPTTVRPARTVVKWRSRCRLSILITNTHQMP